MNDFCRYARENLALVNVYIKDPSVTQVVRDQKVPVIWFVANIGGILGWKTFQTISYKYLQFLLICSITNLKIKHHLLLSSLWWHSTLVYSI